MLSLVVLPKPFNAKSLEGLLIHYIIYQGGRTWQPFVGSKNGNENFRQARIYNFRVKCVVFARNRKFAKLTQWNMQYIPCNKVPTFLAGATRAPVQLLPPCSTITKSPPMNIYYMGSPLKIDYLYFINSYITHRFPTITDDGMKFPYIRPGFPIKSLKWGGMELPCKGEHFIQAAPKWSRALVAAG